MDSKTDLPADQGGISDNGGAHSLRRELLNHRLFELKRFDSAEYAIFSGSFDGEDNLRTKRYFEEIDKAEEYERKHHLSRRHFDSHEEKSAVGGSPLSTEFRPSSGSHSSRAATPASARSFSGTNEIFSPRRLSDVETIPNLSSRKEEGFLSDQGYPADSEDKSANTPFLCDRQANLKVGRGERGRAFRHRLFDKQSTMKHWDSGDFNVLRSFSKLSLPEFCAKHPDLDIRSVSSTDRSESDFLLDEASQSECESFECGSSTNHLGTSGVGSYSNVKPRQHAGNSAVQRFLGNYRKGSTASDSMDDSDASPSSPYSPRSLGGFLRDQFLKMNEGSPCRPSNAEENICAPDMPPEH